MKFYSFKILALFFLLSISLSAQGTPSFKKGVIYLSKYISSEQFKALKTNNKDIDLVDTLYLRALKFYNNDFSESLLALTFACLPYKEMNLKIPVIPVTIKVPLPAVPDPLFKQKTDNLPSRLLIDTPAGDFGDKDKLPHFFGNAFIEYNFPFFNLSEFLGIFTEKFEETFYVQGAMDKRDIKVNRLGAAFGNSLRKNTKLLPSEFFNKYDKNK